MFYFWLAPLGKQFILFNLFNYIAFRAAGAGVTVQEVNRLLNQFEQAQKMMKMVQKGGMAKFMRGMKGILPGMR